MVLSVCFRPGYFMYIEASLLRPGHKARLLTSDLRGSSSPQCLIFYYHMYGSGTGILSVLLRRGSRERDALLWRRRGEQSVSWMRAMVDYHCDVRHQVCQCDIIGVLAPNINSDETPVSTWLLVASFVSAHHQINLANADCVLQQASAGIVVTLGEQKLFQYFIVRCLAKYILYPYYLYLYIN